MANSAAQSPGVGGMPMTRHGAGETNPVASPSSEDANRRYLTEIELANRWGLARKTLQRWRNTGKGPLFAKFSRKVSYPLDGQNGVLDWEQRILYRSTSERAYAGGGGHD